MKIYILCLLVLFGFLTKQCNAAGGVEAADPNDPEVKKALEFAETMMDKAVNSPFTHKVGKVLKAEKQVVSGVKYYLTFEFSETNCNKNQSLNEVGVPCDITKTQICSAQVWSQVWLNKMEILSFSCKTEA